MILLLVKYILSLWTLRGSYKQVGKTRFLKVDNFILENRFEKKQIDFIGELLILRFHVWAVILVCMSDEFYQSYVENDV